MKFLKFLFYSAIILVAAVFYFTDGDNSKVVKGDGNEVAESRELGDFHTIKVQGGYEVFLEQSRTSKIMVEADENLLPKIITEVHNGVLTIKSEDWLRSSNDMKLYISAPEFRGIEVQGAVEIESDEPLESESLSIKVSGAAEVDLELDVEKLSAQFSGAGDVELEGNADYAKVSISGAGKLEAYDLKTDDLTVGISGAGYAEVYAKESLSVSVSGAGSVSYRGNPSNISKSISGAGSVKAD